MTARLTPYRGLRYPFTSDVVSTADVANLAADIDMAIAADDLLRGNAFRLSGARVLLSSGPSITKNTLTVITWNNSTFNNGANGGFGTSNWWSSSTNPSRLTAPTACLVYATAKANLLMTTNLGTNGYFEIDITKNGSTVAPNIQQQKFQPNQTGSGTGEIETSIETVWSLAAGDYLETRVIWNGTPAGPFSLEAGPVMTVQMVAVP